MLVISLPCANRRTQTFQSLPKRALWFTSNQQLVHAGNQVEDRAWAAQKAKAVYWDICKAASHCPGSHSVWGTFFPWEKKAQQRKRMWSWHPHYPASEMFYLYKRRSGPMDRWPISTWGPSVVLLAHTILLSFTQRDSVHDLHDCSMAVTTPK